MSPTLLFVTLAFIIIPSGSGLSVPRSTAPTGWASNLESYDVYHQRYTTFKCYEKHNTQFFKECCRPLLASESPSETLPSLCALSSSSTALGSTSTESSPGNDCEEADDSPTTTHGQDSVATASSSAHGFPSGVPSRSSTAVTSATDGPSSAHTYGVSELASTKKHGEGQSFNSNQAFSGGYATYFYQNGNAGACGAYHGDYDMIAAIDGARYGNLSEKSSLCGKKVKIVNPANGHSVVVTIADACPTCRNANSIDLSVGAFEKLADMNLGIVSIIWWFE